MKRKSFRIATIMVVCLIMFSAFKNNSLPYLVVWCSPDDQIQQLDPAVASPQIQKAKGKPTTASTYSIDGVKSIRRIRLSDICFQVQTSTGQPEPFMYVNLYKLSVGKTNRTFTINNDGSFNPSMIPMQMPLIEPTKYKIYLGGTVSAGEYAFIDKSAITADGKISVWAFGIDP